MKHTLTITYTSNPHGITLTHVSHTTAPIPAGINQVPTNYDEPTLAQIMERGRWFRASDDGHVRIYEMEDGK